MEANNGVLGKNWKKGGTALVVGLAAIWIAPNLLMGSAGSRTYDCKALIPEVVKLSADNPNPLTNVKLLDISAPTTVVAGTDKTIECRGRGFLSDGSEQDIKYHIIQKNDKPWLFFEPIDS